MRNIARCLLMFVVISLCNNTFANEWISYRENVTPVAEQRLAYAVPQIQPVVYYQPMPYVVQQSFIVERQCFFHRVQTVVTRPVTQYYYQPIVLYR